MREGDRVEVMLNRGPPDVWHVGTVIYAAEARVRLDGFHYGSSVVERADITAWRSAHAMGSGTGVPDALGDASP